MTVTSKRHAHAERAKRWEREQKAASIGGAVRDPVPEDVLRDGGEIDDLPHSITNKKKKGRPRAAQASAVSVEGRLHGDHGGQTSFCERWLVHGAVSGAAGSSAGSPAGSPAGSAGGARGAYVLGAGARAQAQE